MVSGRPDADQIRRIRSGDDRAYEGLFYAHAPALIRFAWRFVRNTQISENIVQDVFVKIWRHRDRLDPTLNIKAYLYKAVKNQALQHLRHLKIENRQDDVPEFESPARTPEDALRVKEIGEALDRAIAELPPHRRLIFTLSKFDHFTYAEIAEIQNISIKTVETQMGRALKFLRQRLAGLLTILLCCALDIFCYSVRVFGNTGIL
jgi:RNA polymerase sigma-70 factor (ECF subfamily)